MNLLALALLPALAAAPTDIVPPYMSVKDLSFGTCAPNLSVLPTNTHLGLVPGHQVRFTVVDAEPASKIALLFVSSGLAPAPIPITGTDFLYLDPTRLKLLAAASFGPVLGHASFDLPIPATLLPGIPLATQAATIDVQTLALRTSNPLTHVATDLAPEVIYQSMRSGHPNAIVPGALLVSNQVEWEAFWTAEFSLGTMQPIPAVDFSTKVVVVGFGGQHAILNFSVVIDAVKPHPGGGLEVHQTVVGPGPGCSGAIYSESRPVQVVAVDRVAGANPVISVSMAGQGPPCL
jgi:hypothetical protein